MEDEGNMSNENEMLEQVWIRLVEIKNMVGLCRKGTELEQTRENEQMGSVLHIVEVLLEELIREMDERMV